VTELRNDHSFCPLTLAAEQLTVLEDTHQDARVQGHPLAVSGPRFRFYAGVPMLDEHDNLCGTFCVFDQKPRQLTELARETLSDLAAMAQREIVSEQLRSVHFSLTSKLGIARREAMMDPLTRLWNRRGASMLIRAALDAAAAHGTSVAVALLDLDNFKRINDSFGHQVGDEVLRKAAMRLVQNVRVNDSICRVGGDEFLLLMRNADAGTAAETTERVRRGMTAMPIPTRQGAIPLSTSVGYAVHSGTDATGVEELIRRADQALMHSKTEGRDRVAIFG
jgi:diguanylate cyclase (GGDEF)-like protein